MEGITLIRNSLLASNTYAVDLGSGCAVIIDPGDPDISELKEYIERKGIKEIKVMLTHEHADHCAGVNGLYALYGIELFCSRVIASRISNKKLNLSQYFPQIKPFEVKVPFSVVEEGEIVSICGHDFQFLFTPGHSPGGVCIFVGDAVFTGDTLLNGSKSPLNLPGSNRKDYMDSLEKLGGYLKGGMRIYPGHGEGFVFEE